MLFTLPTLFSRTSTGAIQTWTVEVQEDKYRTSYGQVMVEGRRQTGLHAILQMKVELMFVTARNKLYLKLKHFGKRKKIPDALRK